MQRSLSKQRIHDAKEKFENQVFCSGDNIKIIK
jgi:hypothetical protein